MFVLLPLFLFKGDGSGEWYWISDGEHVHYTDWSHMGAEPNACCPKGAPFYCLGQYICRAAFVLGGSDDIGGQAWFDAPCDEFEDPPYPKDYICQKARNNIQ